MEAGIDNEKVESRLNYSNTGDQAVSYAFESRSSTIGLSRDAAAIAFIVLSHLDVGLLHFLADGDINSIFVV